MITGYNVPQNGIFNKRKKVISFCKISPFEFAQEQKIIEKRQKSRFFAFRIFIEIIAVKPKANIHSKLQSLFKLMRNAFFVLICFPGRDTAFCSSASWSCLDLRHHDCIACWEIARILTALLQPTTGMPRLL